MKASLGNIRIPATSVFVVVLTLLGFGALAEWYGRAKSATADFSERLPIKHRPDVGLAPTAPVADVQGRLIVGQGTAADLAGSWPQFRGPRRDGRAVSEVPLSTAWPAGGPKVLWRTAVGQGYAGAAIHKGRVYLADYDHEAEGTAVRCLSLDDAAEMWRYVYPVRIKQNHGMSRTVPAVTDRYAVTITPLCHVLCLDAATGELRWKMDMVRRFKTIVPPWYTGQCPLIDGDRVILAPGGEPFMIAVELATGEIAWQVPNPGGWKMTHSSIMPAEFDGVRQYVYCGSRGVIGVAADDGRVLWRWDDWRIAIATSPSPAVVGSDRLLLTGDYDAGSQMVRVSRRGETFEVSQLWRRAAKEFSCRQHTPIVDAGRLYAVLPDGHLACADLGGNRLWRSPSSLNSGLAPYMLAGGTMVVLSDETGELIMAEVASGGYRELARAKVLDGNQAWGPMAFADGRLIVRDLTEMICLDLRAE